MNGSPKKSNTLLIIVIVVAVVGVVGIVMVVALVAGVGLFARERYLMDAKKSEGKATVGTIARGIVYCMDREESSEMGEAKAPKELPPSSPAVPASVPKGVKYMSAPSDWTSPAFTCARFTME